MKNGGTYCEQKIRLDELPGAEETLDLVSISVITREGRSVESR